LVQYSGADASSSNRSLRGLKSTEYCVMNKDKQFGETKSRANVLYSKI
jgi:hypothetical protein